MKANLKKFLSQTESGLLILIPPGLSSNRIGRELYDEISHDEPVKKNVKMQREANLVSPVVLVNDRYVASRKRRDGLLIKRFNVAIIEDPFYLNYVKNYDKLIVLFTVFNSKLQYDHISELNLHLCRMDILQDQPRVVSSEIISDLSDLQEETYMLEEDEEFQSNISTYLYVPQVIDIDDKLIGKSNDGWINNKIFSDLQIRGPKIFNLVDIVKGFYPRKQVIYINGVESYGTDLLRSIFLLLLSDKNINYGRDEIFILNDENVDMSAFNSRSKGILITSVAPLDELADIQQLHIVNNYRYGYFNVRRKCLGKHLNISYYITRSTSFESVDLKDYKDTKNLIDKNENNFHNLLAEATPIRYVDKTLFAF